MSWPPEPLIDELTALEQQRGPRGATGASAPAVVDTRFDTFVAGGTLTAKQGLGADNNGLQVGSTALEFAGVAAQDAISGQLVRFQYIGIATMVTGASVTAGNLASFGATNGRVYNHSSGDSFGVIMETVINAGNDVKVLIRPGSA